jgi:Ca-activated chloride channel family protein
MRNARKTLYLLAIALVAGLMLLPAQQGPTKESGETVAKPRKKGGTEQPAEQQKIPSQYNKKDVQTNLPSFKADVTAVSLDVAVLDNKGHFIPGIPKGNFRILEDNVPQQITSFSTSEAPMTICMVIEFSNLFQQYWSEPWYQTLTASYGFLDSLRPDDYVAVVAYDMRPEILSDFSMDKTKAREALARLRIPAFSESNLYDAVTDTAQRMQDIEGRKAILLIASGIDTFSKLTFDKTRKILQTAGVPIYAIGLMQSMREWYDAHGYMGSIQRLDFLQADNQMRTFAHETGGQAFFPRFYGEFPSIFHAIAESLRNQYSLAYNPTNQARDGKFRKIKVELVNPQGEPLKITDQKGKPIKYTLLATKQGYTAPREVE